MLNPISNNHSYSLTQLRGDVVHTLVSMLCIFCSLFDALVVNCTVPEQRRALQLLNQSKAHSKPCLIKNENITHNIRLSVNLRRNSPFCGGGHRRANYKLITKYFYATDCQHCTFVHLFTHLYCHCALN